MFVPGPGYVPLSVDALFPPVDEDLPSFGGDGGDDGLSTPSATAGFDSHGALISATSPKAGLGAPDSFDVRRRRLRRPWHLRFQWPAPSGVRPLSPALERVVLAGRSSTSSTSSTSAGTSLTPAAAESAPKARSSGAVPSLPTLTVPSEVPGVAGTRAERLPLAADSQLCVRVRERRMRPLVFFWNVGKNHWNLIKVTFGVQPGIELFEPMGKPTSRQSKGAPGAVGLSLRALPRDLVPWLDASFPIEGGWHSTTVSAIRNQHQETGFDCGVACLVYAEKVAQGMLKEDIERGTSQADITQFRTLLQRFFASVSAKAAADAEAHSGR